VTRAPLTRRLVLLRHGRTAWNESRRAQGHTDVPLDALGHAQAAAVAPVLAALGPAYVRSSDLARARETAEYVARAAGLELELDPRLREYDVGVRSGLTMAEFAEQYPVEHASRTDHDDPVLVEGEESAAQVRDRVLPALRECFDRLAPGETGIAVLHGACLKVGLLALLDLPETQSQALRVLDNCGWAVVGEHEPGGRRVLVAYNRTASGEHADRAAGGDFAATHALG
jgi:broad specificity phosphatase PhoE